MEGDFIKLPTAYPNDDLDIPWEITSNPKFYPFLKNCLGAVDGSLIPATVPTVDAGIYRRRKGCTAQNILVVVAFDLTFQYVLSGWDGSAHDSPVLDDAKQKGFEIPEGKYYLGDAGYSGSTSLLVPYRNVRYHLKEFQQGNTRYVIDSSLV